MGHRMDKHTPTGIRNSSAFSCSRHSPPRDPETGSAVGARVGALEFPLQKQEPSAEAQGRCIFNRAMNYRAAWIPASVSLCYAYICLS